jgi:hypothetical protein
MVAMLGKDFSRGFNETRLRTGFLVHEETISAAFEVSNNCLNRLFVSELSRVVCIPTHAGVKLLARVEAGPGAARNLPGQTQHRKCVEAVASLDKPDIALQLLHSRKVSVKTL